MIRYFASGFVHARNFLLSQLMINTSVELLAQVGFAFTGTPKVFRIFGGCRTRASTCVSALKQLRHPEIASLSAGLGIPENTQAPLPKISIRSKNRQIHFLDLLDMKGKFITFEGSG